MAARETRDARASGDQGLEPPERPQSARLRPRLRTKALRGRAPCRCPLAPGLSISTAPLETREGERGAAGHQVLHLPTAAIPGRGREDNQPASGPPEFKSTPFRPQGRVDPQDPGSGDSWAPPPAEGLSCETCAAAVLVPPAYVAVAANLALQWITLLFSKHVHLSDGENFSSNGSLPLNCIGTSPRAC